MEWGTNMIKTKKHFAVLIASCLLMASSVGLCMNSVGIFYSPIAEDMGVGRGDIAMQSTLSGIAAGLISPFVVKSFQQFNTRLCACSGVILTVLTTALMAASTSPLQLDILGFIRGASYSFFSIIPVNMVLLNWFQHSHGLITGFVFSFSGLGGVLFNALLGMVIVEFGWQIGYLVVAGLILILAFPACFFISLPLKKGKAAEQQKTSSIEDDSRCYSDTQILTSPMFIGLGLFALAITFLVGFGQFMPDFSAEIGSGLTFGAAMLSFAMVGNILSKFILGWLSDQKGPVFAVLVMLSSSISGLIIMLLCSIAIPAVPPLLLAAALLFGATYSITAVGASLLTRRFFGLANYGEAYGYMSILLNVGAAIPFALIGYSYDLFHTYQAAILICLALCLLSVVLLISLGKKAANSPG